MLKLANITKNYKSGDEVVKALKGINLEFRSNEFVSILGPSGCGKTTLLNIIGDWINIHPVIWRSTAEVPKNLNIKIGTFIGIIGSDLFFKVIILFRTKLF